MDDEHRRLDKIKNEDLKDHLKHLKSFDETDDWAKESEEVLKKIVEHEHELDSEHPKSKEDHSKEETEPKNDFEGFILYYIVLFNVVLIRLSKS